MKRWGWESFLSLFLSTNCPLCDRKADICLCSSCRRQLQRCQLPASQAVWEDEIKGFAWGAYQGVLKRAIAVLKYDNQPQLAEPLGQWMGVAWLKTSPFPPPHHYVVVPIPLHTQRQQQRGFNQAELLALSFCRFTGLRLQSQGLKRDRETQAMYSLNPEERAENLKNAFCLGTPFQKRLPRSPVLLLDDIYTTGATIRSARQILTQAGIPVAGVVTLAKTSFNHESATNSYH
ncbi:ComF family protein [Spirulina subsalsa FACHB-351]|uniref:ComF family protein n=1 Tax=Spirulina subsalsa FACHB-351 TaxID=234711 RepID=A0ABT3L2L0_9CYAN|nr:ComF family protein [Spirulina subsalsa]MCW6035230.1 ComF family protein [Spirulina subsalsa FACHB-351]